MIKKKWLKIHLNDKYIKQAKKFNIRSRSWFKLEEIQKQDKIIKKNDNIIELGSYPGGWSQFIAKIIKKKNKIFSCDLLPMKKIKYINFTQGNICQKKTIKKILKKTKYHNIQVILSDISPNLTGIKEIDNIKYMKIFKKIIYLCKKKLHLNGNFVIKTFLGLNFTKITKKIKPLFKTIKIRKPKSSYTFSKEIYIIAIGYKKNKY